MRRGRGNTIQNAGMPSIWPAPWGFIWMRLFRTRDEPSRDITVTQDVPDCRN